MEVWRRRGKAASARLSAALYSVYSGLYLEAVVSSVASAVVLAEVGQFREAVQYVQKAAKALYETAKEVFERVKVAVQRLVELFVEAVARMLAWVDEHKAYLFLMAAAAAGAVALGVALNLWGLAELEKLAYAASLTPFVAGLADAGGKVAERFRALAERWKVDDNEKKQMIENIINEIINAPLGGKTSQSSRRPYGALLKLAESANLPRPLVELREALEHVEDEVEKDATVVAALVLYKTLVKNAGAYREWAELYKWARGLVEKQEFTVTAEEVRRLREAHRRLEEVAEEVGRELNNVLALYALHSRDLYERLKPHLQVDLGKAEELAEARSDELSKNSDVNMGTKVYAALLSAARGGIYGHAAMLLAGEGALADIVLSTPGGAYEKARDIARGRDEAVDPSYSGWRRRSVGQPSWEDRAAPALLRYLLSKAGDEELKFRRVKVGDGKVRRVEGFDVFKAYGGVETRIDVLKIGESVAYSKATGEELRRFVEEARRKAPDLTGIRKIWQTLAWCTTDMSFTGRQIEATTAHTWQAAWYIALLGEPESSRGGANVTKGGIKPNIKMRWPREVLDRIIAAEGNELKPLLGRAVRSWRELVDAVDWSWVLKRVEELADGLKPWVGPEKMGDAEREGHVRRMLGELALLVHFAEARRGVDDRKWREKRAKRLARAVETLSNGRITGKYAERLARAIIHYAEGRKNVVNERIENLAEEVGISREEVWGVVEFVLSDMYCLARDCARDEVVRKFVEPALELIMLDKALKGEFDRERAKLLFGEMYATAIAGDGHVESGKVVLAVGGELGGGAALLRLAALLLLNQLLPDEPKFDVHTYAVKGSYIIAAYSGNAARFKRFLAVTAPSAGGGYLSEKFNEFVKKARVEVRPGGVRLTKSDVAADLTISEAGAAVKYNVYLLKDAIVLQFVSTDRGRAELAARLLKLAGVSAKMKKVGERDEWHVIATTDRLAAGREELRNALVKIVRRAVENGWVDADRSERWLKKLEEGLTLREGWPKYYVGLSNSGALEVKYQSPDPYSIERETQRLKNMGLVEGVHFSVKMPEGEGRGYVSVLKEGLTYAAWLSVYGEGERQKLVAEFVEYILQRAKEAGEDVRKKAEEVVEEGRARGSLTLKGFEKRVEVEGREHVVKVIDGGAELEESQRGKKLLRLKITAEVDGVVRKYGITFSRREADNKAVGFAVARADAPGGREADAERLAAVIKALTGREPRVYRMKNGAVKIECGRAHLEGFKRFAELADAIARWLEETSR